MTTPLDFASRPPEINSALMYMGAGAGPMLAVASAWNQVAAELRTTALSYTSILSTLADEEWLGPASASMAAAGTRYAAWMDATAVQAEQAALQATSAAAAYEAAFAATVPPPVIALNRSELAVLVATNVLGLNTPAIMAAELHYIEMWAQDAAAMSSYAVSSAAAAQLTPFTEAPQVVNPSGLAARDTAISVAQQSAAATRSISDSLGDLWNGLLSGAEGGGLPWPLGPNYNFLYNLMTDFGPNAGIWNTLAFFGTSFGLPTTWMGIAAGEVAAEDVTEGAATAAGAGALGSMLADPVESAVGLGSVSASTGNAALAGKLAVPQSWTAAAPPIRAASAEGTPMVMPGQAVAGAAGMPGMPLGSKGGQSFGRAVPQYGFRSKFVVRPPSAG